MNMNILYCKYSKWRWTIQNIKYYWIRKGKHGVEWKEFTRKHNIKNNDRHSTPQYNRIEAQKNEKRAGDDDGKQKKKNIEKKNENDSAVAPIIKY